MNIKELKFFKLLTALRGLPMFLRTKAKCLKILRPPILSRARCLSSHTAGSTMLVFISSDMSILTLSPFGLFFLPLLQEHQLWTSACLAFVLGLHQTSPIALPARPSVWMTVSALCSLCFLTCFIFLHSSCLTLKCSRVYRLTYFLLLECELHNDIYFDTWFPVVILWVFWPLKNWLWQCLEQCGAQIWLNFN